MLYAILCYHKEDVVGAWTREEEDACMARLAVVQEDLARQGRLGPVARLLPTTAAATVRMKRRRAPLVVDGPFAETKEQLLGFYLIECQDLDEAIEVAPPAGDRQPRRHARGAAGGALFARSCNVMSELAWIDAALTSARPQALSALLRYFRDFDTARGGVPERLPAGVEETGRKNGPPRDPVAWLVLVGPQCRHPTRSARPAG